MPNKSCLVRLARRFATLCALTTIAYTANAQTVRLHGSVTLEKLLTPKKQALETQTALKLEIIGNGAGRGLSDLANGRAEIALMAGPLKGVAAAMNKDKPGSVDITGITEIPVSNVKIAFITHPSANVKALTAAQGRDLLTGKTTNWKQVGGADLPVKVVLAFPGDGARITTQEVLLQGADYVSTAIMRNSGKDIAVVVAQLPGACGILSSKNVEGSVTTVTLDKEVVMPLQLATKGEPSGDVKKVVDAVKAALQ